MASLTHRRRVEPLARDWHHVAWDSGSFDTARRPVTREVEGVIAVPHDLLLVTLAGGARHLDVAAECGHRYAGADFAGAVSYVPAGCGRRLRMGEVEAEWASVSLRPDLMTGAIDGRRVDIPTFTNIRDPFIASAIAELHRLRAQDGGLESGYCDAMARALAKYLVYRHGTTVPAPRTSQRLPAWRLRRVTEFVEAHLDARLTVEDLAQVAGLSAGHFHRALRQTVGQTPLEFLNRRRIDRARQKLAAEGCSIVELSLQVGFASPSHFSRLFRRLTGVSPAAYRDGAKRRLV
jgi:AraC family transcriptional regulator